MHPLFDGLGIPTCTGGRTEMTFEQIPLMT